MGSYDFNSKTDSGIIKSHLITILQQTSAVPFMIHNNNYKCFYCDSSFDIPSKLRDHTTSAHEFMNFDENLSIWSDFNLQSNLLLDIANLNCKTCNIRLANTNDLKIHYNEKHLQILPKDLFENVIYFKLNDNSIICHRCSQNFNSLNDLLEHMISHVHLNCETCNEVFLNETDFLDHENTHCKPCRLCDLRFQSKSQRDLHVRDVHCQNPRCDFCSLPIKSKQTLARHIRNIHYKEKNRTCDICGKTFFDTNYLNLHKVSHQNAKPFECDICKKKFPRRESLNWHKRIHYDDRRYLCKICGKAFVQWTTLNMHKAVHSQERKYKCAFCNNTYKENNSLISHVKKKHQAVIDETKSEEC